jgi:hypothetical protein
MSRLSEDEEKVSRNVTVRGHVGAPSSGKVEGRPQRASRPQSGEMLGEGGEEARRAGRGERAGSCAMAGGGNGTCDHVITRFSGWWSVAVPIARERGRVFVSKERHGAACECGDWAAVMACVSCVNALTVSWCCQPLLQGDRRLRGINASDLVDSAVDYDPAKWVWRVEEGRGGYW